MKILFVAPYVPSRIRVRPFQILKELAKRHEVYVVAQQDPSGDAAGDCSELESCLAGFEVVPHSKIRGYCQAIAALPTPVPMCAAFCISPKTKRAVTQALDSGKFDVIHVEHLRAASFFPRRNGRPVVFDSVDCLTDLFGQMSKSATGRAGKFVAAEESWKLRTHEPKVMKRFDRVLVTSDAEQKKIADLDSEIIAEVIPNGVDVEHFAPMGTSRKPDRLVFIGKMGFLPNSQAVLWFAENVFPDLKAKYPELEFIAVGKDPPREVAKLSEIPGVQITGYVDDIRPYLNSASIAVAPMQVAVGVQNKVLESMSMALPVVATPITTTAFNPGHPGILAAATPEQMTAQISCLIDQPAEAAEIGLRGREEVKTHFSWSASVAKLERIYQELVG